MFCAQIKFLQYFKNLKQGGRLPPPPVNPLKYCKNVVGAQNMLTYFRLRTLLIYLSGGLISLKLFS